MNRFKQSALYATPLAIAYVALPVARAVQAILASDSTAPAAFPWLFVAAIGLVLGLYRPSPGEPRSRGFALKASLFVLFAAGAIVYGRPMIPRFLDVMPYLRELSPLVFLLLAGLWTATCGAPTRADFQRYGALLGALCLIDLLVELVVIQAVPSTRLLGDPDSLAALLLVSLCAGLRPGPNEGGLTEPDQGNQAWRMVVMLGILSCLSRAGLFAAAWAYLCFGRGPFLRRSGYTVACLALLGATFMIPGTASDPARYVDYWLWIEALRLWVDAPSLIFTGFSITGPLPFKFPVTLTPIWEAVTGQPTSFGIYLSQVPSFWLRLILGWGVGVPLAILSAAFVMLFNRLSRMGAGLIAVLFAQGMATPLLFEPPLAVITGLAFATAMIGVKDTADDPAEEWDMRPL